jgi:hypothetical protein
MLIGGINFTRVVGGSAKRPVVSYKTENGGQLKSREGVEAYLLKKGIEVSEQVRAQLELLNFDPEAQVDDTNGIEQDNMSTDRQASKATLEAAPEGAAAAAEESNSPAEAPSKKRSKVAGGDGDGAASAAGQAADEDEPEYKRRNRAIAQSRAAAFARGSG